MNYQYKRTESNYIVALKSGKYLLLTNKGRVSNKKHRFTRLNKFDIEVEYYDVEGKVYTIKKPQLLKILRKGVPNGESTRKAIFEEFGTEIFGLTDYERRYFTANFRSRQRLEAFLKTLGRGGGYYSFEEGSIYINRTKVKKALRELYVTE